MCFRQKGRDSPFFTLLNSSNFFRKVGAGSSFIQVNDVFSAGGLVSVLPDGVSSSEGNIGLYVHRNHFPQKGRSGLLFTLQTGVSSSER